MVLATTRWTLYILALVVVGPAAGLIMGLTDAPDGSAGTAMTSASPALGIISLVLGSVLAAAIGGVAAWRCGFRPGLTCAGIVLCWMAGMSSGMTSTIATNGQAPWGSLLLEGVVVCVCLLGIGVVLALAGQRHTPVEGEHIVAQSEEAMESEPALTASVRTAAAVAVAVIGGAAVAWLLAVTDLRGQIIATAAIAAVAITVIIKLIDVRSPGIAGLAAAALLAIATPAFAMVRVPAGDALAEAYAQTLPGLVLVTPLDWAAGALLGTPLGLAWAASIVKRAAT